MKLIQKYFMFLLSLTIMASMCFGSPYTVSAQSQTQGVIEDFTPPLYPDLTWENLGSIQKYVYVTDQILTLSGNMFEAIENLDNEIPESVFSFYSIKNLQSLGWDFVGNAGFESTYWHSSGKYLIVRIIECPNSETEYCVNIWQSVDSSNYPPPAAQSSSAPDKKLVAFNKTSPANGSTIPLPASTFQLLKWSNAEIGSTDRYQYCIDETNNQQCDSNDWLARNSLYSGPDFTVSSGRTYYWQVRVRDGGISANGGTWWSFSIQASSSAGPIVSSIVRANPTGPITTATSVSFTVTFNQAVTGVDVGDFTLTTTGVSGAGISGVTGSGSIYTVTVNTGTGDGNIRLDVTDNDSIINSSGAKLGGVGVGNGNYTGGQSYTINRTPPTVLSSIPATVTTIGLVNFTVTFSESVTGVDFNDFALDVTGNVSGAQITVVGGSGSTRTVTVNVGGVGSGTIRLNVIDNDSILDAASVSLGGAGAGNGNFFSGTPYNKPIFADVPYSFWANNYVERLYNAGITSGCGSGNYCPDSTVTRAEMAVFLLKGKHGSTYNPPAVGASTGFTDVPVSYWASAWIKQLAAEGITGGCGVGIYCPDATVTRAQMAIFLLKAKHTSSYNPPAASGVFTDVPVGYWADKWIEQLAAEGITSGCGVGIYCPDSSATRAQMAVFLVKTFNLP